MGELVDEWDGDDWVGWVSPKGRPSDDTTPGPTIVDQGGDGP